MLGTGTLFIYLFFFEFIYLFIFLNLPWPGREKWRRQVIIAHNLWSNKQPGWDAFSFSPCVITHNTGYVQDRHTHTHTLPSFIHSYTLLFLMWSEITRHSDDLLRFYRFILSKFFREKNLSSLRFLNRFYYVFTRTNLCCRTNLFKVSFLLRFSRLSISSP